MQAYRARKPTRESITGQVTQTAALGAFVGGFAFITLHLPGKEEGLDIAIYLFTCFSVVACMCSALTGAILYRTLEAIHDDDVVNWSRKPLHRLILSVPWLSFVVGGGCFIIGAQMKFIRDLSDLDKGQKEAAQAFASIATLIGVGIIGVSMKLVGSGPRDFEM